MAEPKNDPRPKIQKQVKRSVWQRDKGCCVECGSKEKLEYDHIIPLSKGGSDTERNIQLLCERCNRMKFTKTDKAVAFAHGTKQALAWASRQARGRWGEPLDNAGQASQENLGESETAIEHLHGQILHALRVEGKSMRQVSRETGLSRRQISPVNSRLFPNNTPVARAMLDRDVVKLASALLSPEDDLGKGHDAKQLLSALTRLGVLPPEQEQTGGNNNVMIAIGSPSHTKIHPALEPPPDGHFFAASGEQTAKVKTLEVTEDKGLINVGEK